jgi:hypothetical protein
VAEAVVFEQGTAILLKTPETKDIISTAIKETGLRGWAWIRLGNDLSNQLLKKCQVTALKKERLFL